LPCTWCRRVSNQPEPGHCLNGEERIEAKAAAQAEAAKPTETTYAQFTVLAMQRRTLADALQVGLVRFKRDLKNQGMTEAQPSRPHPRRPRPAASP
jgi:hypothetical protein